MIYGELPEITRRVKTVMPLIPSNQNKFCFIHKDCIGINKGFIRAEVCKDFPASYEFEGNHYCILHLPDVTKGSTTEFNQSISSKIQKFQNKFTYIFVPDAAAFFSKAFTSDAYFDNATFFGQADFRQKTFEYKAYFRNAVFLERAIFKGAKFSKDVDFSLCMFEKEAEFDDARFLSNANFSSTTFLGNVIFHSATFSKITYFVETIFHNKTVFNDAKFLEGVDFTSATFRGEIDFIHTWFSDYATFRHAVIQSEANVFFKDAKCEKEVNFRNTIISGHLTFEGRKDAPIFLNSNSWFSLQNAQIEKSERLSFKNVRLRPNWFINIDARKFIFHDVDWENSNGSVKKNKIELEEIKKRSRSARPHRILAIACRHLAVNAEENGNYEQASSFRQMANESKRLEENNKYKILSLHWWYWLSSFYGESPLRAGLVLAAILLIFAVAFMNTEFQVCPIVKTIPETECQIRTLNVWESALQSLATATFQNIDYIKSYSKVNTFLIIVEKIIAPLQVALLALAIRRKFMR